MEGIKYDQEKPRYELVPWDMFEQVVHVLTYGSQKYDDDNWMKIDKKRYFSALHRHIKAWYCGERDDSETGMHHMAHAICCALFIMWHDLVGKNEQ